jgi:hypothetical protein
MPQIHQKSLPPLNDENGMKGSRVVNRSCLENLAVQQPKLCYRRSFERNLQNIFTIQHSWLEFSRGDWQRRKVLCGCIGDRSFEDWSFLNLAKPPLRFLLTSTSGDYVSPLIGGDTSEVVELSWLLEHVCNAQRPATSERRCKRGVAEEATPRKKQHRKKDDPISASEFSPSRNSSPI